MNHDGLSMDRDPAPAPGVPRASEPPAAQPLAEIVVNPPARPSRPPVPPPMPVREPVELTIDGVAVAVPAGSTILDACRAQGIDTPTLCVSAADDPFVPPEVLTRVQAAVSKSIDFRMTSCGGHVGFISGSMPWRCEYWAEELVVNWLIDHSS